MGRPLPRAFACFGLSILAVVLIWGGYAIWQQGRDIGAQEARFATEYLLGAQLLWLLSGAVGAGIIGVSSQLAKKSVSALLAAAIPPLLMVLPIYVWSNPDIYSWLLPSLPIPNWVISPYVQAAAPVLLGVFLGAALWRSSSPRAIGQRADAHLDSA